MTKQEIIKLVVEKFSDLKCTFRLKTINKPLTNKWASWVIQPEKGYIESDQIGPVKISEVDWIEINPIERIYIGIRITDKSIDHTETIRNYFDKNFIQYKINEGIFQIVIQDN